MELVILKYLAAFFLFLSIIRPLVRGLWKLHGLTVCPLLALGIIAAIFPAYGFRPECIPLLLFALFLSFANLPDIIALFFGLQSDSYIDRGILFTLSSAAVFAFTLWISVYFAPPLISDLHTEGVETIFLQRGRLHIRIYGPQDTAAIAEETGRPLLIFLPPVAGSFGVSDTVCTALRDRGFTVLSLSRLNFDSPSFDQDGTPVRLFFGGIYRLGSAIISGLNNTTANARGRNLEESRRIDTIYLLGELARNSFLSEQLSHTDINTIFLAGYGAGGAAITVLAGRDDIIERFPQLKGVIAIEAPLLSSLEGDPLPPPPPLPADPVKAFYQQTLEFVQNLIPRKITHIADIPKPALPLMFILSDRIILERTGRYETVLRTLGASRNMALLAAVPGAGPFDYSDSPRLYPLLSFLFRGADPLENDPVENNSGALAENQNIWPELTATLIANFAAFILENNMDDSREIPQEIPIEKTALENIYLEKGGVWHFPAGQTILHP